MSAAGQISIAPRLYSLLLSKAYLAGRRAFVVRSSGRPHRRGLLNRLHYFFSFTPASIVQNACIPCIRLPSFIFSQCEKGSRPVLVAGVNVFEAFYPWLVQLLHNNREIPGIFHMGDRAIYICVRQENALHTLKIAANQLKLPVFIEY